ncbi:MAG: D-glycero-beta-D-manno-heptose 1-phosphate adenylyltransferase [bacterium]|nr:D-glycero-beta-D-manno-heptose 1-phosphate adenylyltransferase [bacterium]
MHLNKIKDIKELMPIIEKLKKENKKIVFTNGCFDILHLGHIRYLNEAKKLGDILIVAVNSDTSVLKLKGSKRPLYPQYARLEALAALFCVDYVTFFNELDPYKIISQIVPHILVKGGDYQIEKIIGRDIVCSHGGEVVIIPELEGFSTTKLISTIVEKYGKEII